MTTVLLMLGALLVVFGVAALATREGAGTLPVEGDRPDVALPASTVSGQDVRDVRFGLALRGYRMRDVDAVLERLARELEERDRQPAEQTDDPEPVDLVKRDDPPA